jgi:hypothetical protein
METKDQLINTIRQWVKLDNEMRALQKELGTRKKEKSRISESLIAVMKQNEIDCFDLKDGNIQYVKKNIKKPITQKSLLTILSTFYKGDDERADKLKQFIMDHREEVVKETIVRKIDAP